MNLRSQSKVSSNFIAVTSFWEHPHRALQGRGCFLMFLQHRVFPIAYFTQPTCHANAGK